MKKYLIFLTLLMGAFSLSAQRHDNIWLMGYYGAAPHPDLGGIMFDFNQEPPLIQDANTNYNFRKTASSSSNEEGEFQFATNGVHILGPNYEIMEGGDSLSAYGITFDYYYDGMNFVQLSITLPVPENDSLYHIFHKPVDWNPEISAHFPRLYRSTINMNGNGGLGTVTEIDQILIQDTLLAGKLTATKHGNGRDWWVIDGKVDEYTNVLFPILVTPDSIEVRPKQDAGPGIAYETGAVGQAVFSPDGSKYIRHDVRFDPFNVIDIYDFNRCTGVFTHLEHFEFNDTTSGLSGGVAVSPDSRFLYVITRLEIFQYDMTAPDILATETTVAEYDNYIAYNFESAFTSAQLAPNGKIYFASSSTDTVMHIIHAPGQEGMACHVEQHSIALPTLNGRTVPNHPNYRLGPLDGSPCDTLGLDNSPMAGFAHFAEELSVTFSDNSYYRPELWEWDFGDSNGSGERNPVHIYDAPGEYEVCLTVSNENGGDTFCRWVEVDTLAVVGTVETSLVGGVSIYPNPVRTQMKIKVEKPLPYPSALVLYDMTGREVRRWDMSAGQAEAAFWAGGIPSGLYFWNLTGKERRLASGKVMVVE